MTSSPAYRPDPKFMALGRDFSDPVDPADFPMTRLRFRNDRAAATVGLETLSDAAWIAAFGRFEPLPGNQPQPLAMRYHGHQFRSYNPDLGDGRGFLFAQLREQDSDRLLDLATKGSGQTPWSRQGDGRLTLKGGMREILAASLLEALGVPTSRAFSLVETGEDLQRGDEPSPTRSAVLTRLSHSHIRFGTFQRQAYFERPDLITVLVDHAVETYYPHLADAPDRPAVLMRAVVEASARLLAGWMAAGSFGRQPEAVFWNLQQLAACLTLVTDQAGLLDALNGFSDAYRDALRAAMLRRLALKPRDLATDMNLVSAAFKALAAGGDTLRWEPFFFDWFGGSASEGRAMAGPRAALYGEEAFADFRRRLAEFEPDRPERLDHPIFAQPDPEELLIEHVEALWAPIASQDDWSPLHAKLDRIEAARRAYGFGDDGAENNAV
ncbi:MAG: selenoprotein O [Caulobacter sp. 12-67-6]|nr:MAG: selenoprotein O [Caulobacter sp. 12-67-6]